MNNWIVKYIVQGEFEQHIVMNTRFNDIKDRLETYHNCIASEIFIISVERDFINIKEIEVI